VGVAIFKLATCAVQQFYVASHFESYARMKRCNTNMLVRIAKLFSAQASTCAVFCFLLPALCDARAKISRRARLFDESDDYRVVLYA